MAQPPSARRNDLPLVADVVASTMRGDSVEATLDLICRRVCEIAGFRFCGVLVPDADWLTFRLAGGHALPPEYVLRLADLFRVRADETHEESPTWQAARQRRTIVNPDVLEAPASAPWHDLALEFGYRAMVSIPLFAGSEVIGVLNGYADERRDPPRTEVADIETLAAHAAVALALESVRAKAVSATEERLESAFLHELFRGDREAGPELSARAARHGLSLEAPSRVVAMAPDGDEGLAEFARLARLEVSRTPGALALADGLGVVAVIPGSSGADALATAEHLIGRLEAAFERTTGAGFSAGVGAPTTVAADFAASKRDADVCLTLARKLGRSRARLVRDRLGLLGLFIDTNDPEQLRRLADDVLGPAIRSDARRGGGLIPTLLAYLNCGNDLAACAAALFVHPNTVKYRLRRLQELCSLNLRHADDLLSARVASLAHLLL